VLSLGSALHLFVRRLLLRSSLNYDEVEAVRGLKGEMREVSARVDVIRQGDHVNHVCLVADGLLARFGQNRSGVRQTTAFHIAGAMADLPSMLNPRTSWGVATVAATTLVQIPHAELRRVAASFPGVAEAFWRDCAADSLMYSEWTVNLGRRDAAARLAHLFCEMGIRYERAGQGDRCSFVFPATQVDLGDATGLTSVHVNRTLKTLRERGVVSKQRARITVHDWEQLANIGDFDSAFMALDEQSPRIAVATVKG
jgi:CRP-like cAMP-binding protein